MLAIVTSISGSGRKDYLRDFEKYAKKNHKKIKIYYVGNMLFEHAQKIGVFITPENVLNANPYVLNSLRSAVFEKIMFSLPKDLKENEVVIISIHSFFYWKKIFTRAYDRFYLRQFDPDIFITFIDDTKVVLNKLNSREQWKSEKLTEQELLLWQNVEVEVTASWAEMGSKPFFVIPVRQPVTTLYRIFFSPKCEPVYISMPMTHLKSRKDKEKIDKFFKVLERYFIVFDPRNVEVGGISPEKKSNLIIYTQTVNRDLYWLIKQSKKIIAYFPRIVSSPGVVNELREAYETNKDVWLIYPAKVASPFLTYFCNRMFSKEKEFFAFLKKNYKDSCEK